MGMISDMLNGPALKKENKKLKKQLDNAKREKEQKALHNHLSESPKNIVDLFEKLDRIAEEKTSK